MDLHRRRRWRPLAGCLDILTEPDHHDTDAAKLPDLDQTPIDVGS